MLLRTVIQTLVFYFKAAGILLYLAKRMLNWILLPQYSIPFVSFWFLKETARLVSLAHTELLTHNILLWLISFLLMVSMTTVPGIVVMEMRPCKLYMQLSKVTFQTVFVPPNTLSCPINNTLLKKRTSSNARIVLEFKDSD